MVFYCSSAELDPVGGARFSRLVAPVHRPTAASHLKMRTVEFTRKTARLQGKFQSLLYVFKTQFKCPLQLSGVELTTGCQHPAEELDHLSQKQAGLYEEFAVKKMFPAQKNTPQPTVVS